MKTRKKDIYFVPSAVLLVLGMLDLIRGFMHTFNVNWSAANVAKLNLAAGGDQLFLLGTFGISNFLTGILFIYMSKKAKELAPTIIIIIPIAYVIGIIGLMVAGVSRSAEFNGKYFMLVYMAACILTFIKFQYDKHKDGMDNHGSDMDKFLLTRNNKIYSTEWCDYEKGTRREEN